MSKDFVESCKLLQKHFYRITADSNINYNTKKEEILTKAENIIQEESDTTIDNQIEDLAEKSIMKYVKEMDNYLNPKPKYRHKCCRSKNIYWKDDIWDTPNPKKSKFTTNNSSLTQNSSYSKVVPMQINTFVEEAEIKSDDNLINEKISENNLLESLQIEPIHTNYKICLSVKKIDIEKIDDDLISILEEENNFRNLKNKENSKIETKHDITSPQMELKIKNFLDNLEQLDSSSINLTDSEKSTLEKKSKTILIPPKINSNYENRFKAQKEIIDQQKKRLKEQEKLIEELKLKKINEEASLSLKKCTKIYQETIKNSEKYHWKSIVTKTNPKSETDDICNDLKTAHAPKIVQTMEKRAKQREERRLLIKERKRLLDEERKRQAQEIIDRKKNEEQKEKEERLQLLKQEREKRKQIALQKKIDKIKFLEQNRNAFLHYRKKLLFRGLESLKNAVIEKNAKEEIATKFYEFNTTLNFFKSWQNLAFFSSNNKKNKADKFFERKIHKKCFKNWKKFHQENVQKMQVAQDFFEMKLQYKIFISFHQLICIYHVEYMTNLTIAQEHYCRQILFQTFGAWQTLPEIMKIEKKKNERKQKWRQKVSEILPDYKPILDD